MTPQEKAKDIVDKIYKYMPFWNVKLTYCLENKKLIDDMEILSSKQCALIAVTEAEKSEYNVLIKFGVVTKNYKSDYWEQVKQEIEKL